MSRLKLISDICFGASNQLSCFGVSNQLSSIETKLEDKLAS